MFRVDASAVSSNVVRIPDTGVPSDDGLLLPQMPQRMASQIWPRTDRAKAGNLAGAFFVLC